MPELAGGVRLSTQHLAIDHETDADAFRHADVGKAVDRARSLRLQPEPRHRTRDRRALDEDLHAKPRRDGRAEVDVPPSETRSVDQLSSFAIDHARKHDADALTPLAAVRRVQAK